VIFHPAMIMEKTTKYGQGGGAYPALVERIKSIRRAEGYRGVPLVRVDLIKFQ